jgi:hypothetical protein
MKKMIIMNRNFKSIEKGVADRAKTMETGDHSKNGGESEKPDE